MLQPLGSDPLGEVSDPQTEEYASINAENKLAPDTLLVRESMFVGSVTQSPHAGIVCLHCVRNY